ncbi:MAG: formyltetrahydrofolate deformylase [Chloroflexi bacterium]|nr:formyltetrahydrofolate deformylase [Chloroflexota bacterium]
MIDTPTEGTARLLVQCPDQPGIVAAVSQYLDRHGANMVRGDQHSTGGEDPRFFLRVEYNIAGLDGSATAIAEGFGEEVAARFAMDWHVSYSANRPRIAILGTREPNCVLDLLWRARTEELAADVVMVISNREILRPLAERFSVPFEHLPVTRETKVEQEKEMLELLCGRVDLVVLARYMQILTPTFLDAYPQQIINIHHSFLPAFAGADPYGQAEERGVKIIGATAHYATAELDAGPIIEQDVLRVTHRDTRADLMRVGRELERQVLARAVRWHIEDRVLVHDNKTVVFQ